MTQKLQQQQQGQQQQQQDSNSTLLDISKEDQQRLRRRSEGDAPTKQQKQQQQLQQQQQQQQHHQHQLEQKFQHQTPNANKAYASDTITTLTHTHTSAAGGNAAAAAANGSLSTFLPPRRVSLGDSSESNNRSAATANTASGELQVKCRNTKCDRTATPLDAKKYYKSCHNCTYLYCSRECRRAHWEKHRKACLHSRVSNLCRQVLASCKDDSDSLRHLSLLARKGFLSQGRGVVRILFRSPESAEGFIKNGFQCMGEASYVRWPDLMPAEMGLELYSELLKLSTEYRPDSKMLVYVAVCVVSEAPSVGQAPVRWERQLVSRCAKLKLCKTVLAELEHQPMGVLQQPVTMVAVPEPTTEVLILTFNPQLRNSTAQREMVLSNILDILSRRGVILRKHYPEIFQRFQSYTEGQTEKINPVTLHPRDSQTGQNFVCIIMPVQSDTEIIKLPSMADGGNRVTTIDVGSPTAISQLEDNEMLTRTSMAPNAS
ncbi:apical junction component 1 homolog [Musca domestica]|uniref:Apical junction component 1 homolog n=1 Tax=Musca domestica TaxID=7370 RepID=A0ABM3VQR0_MUSDO|nr:apical junction component 1 homolog [Musca domestica]XP_058988141.1 apical junction component 1 homolog [Musca domestica]